MTWDLAIYTFQCLYSLMLGWHHFTCDLCRVDVWWTSMSDALLFVQILAAFSFELNEIYYFCFHSHSTADRGQIAQYPPPPPVRHPANLRPLCGKYMLRFTLILVHDRGLLFIILTALMIIRTSVRIIRWSCTIRCWNAGQFDYYPLPAGLSPYTLLYHLYVFILSFHAIILYRLLIIDYWWLFELWIIRLCIDLFGYPAVDDLVMYSSGCWTFAYVFQIRRFSH